MSPSKTLTPEYEEQVVNAGAVGVRLWDAAVLFGVVSLLDVLEDKAESYVAIGRLFEQMMFGMHAVTMSSILPQGHFDDMIRQLTELQDKCSEMQMEVTPDLVKQAVEYFHRFRDQVSYAVVMARAGELYRAFTAELSKQRFFRLQVERVKYYAAGHASSGLFGEQVDTEFPDARYDIREAGRCLATERDTACVLHLMRVLEVGLQKLASRFEVSFERRNWENVISDVEAKIRDISTAKSKPENWKQEEERYADIAKEFRYLKNAWRNHAMHIRHRYDFEEAEKVYTHVREFMQHLASPYRPPTRPVEVNTPYDR